MKLQPTLKAKFLRWRSETSTEQDAQGMYVFRDETGDIKMWSPTPTRDLFDIVNSLSEAHGISFLCPKDFAKNNGPAGTHSVRIYFEGSPVPPHIGTNKDGATVRWKVIGGTSLDDLQLAPSILEQDNSCQWHGFVGSSGVPPGEAA